jgi:hypothetical protein
MRSELLVALLFVPGDSRDVAYLSSEADSFTFVGLLGVSTDGAPQTKWGGRRESNPRRASSTTGEGGGARVAKLCFKERPIYG